MARFEDERSRQEQMIDDLTLQNTQLKSRCHEYEMAELHGRLSEFEGQQQSSHTLQLRGQLNEANAEVRRLDHHKRCIEAELERERKVGAAAQTEYSRALNASEASLQSSIREVSRLEAALASAIQEHTVEHKAVLQRLLESREFQEATEHKMQTGLDQIEHRVQQEKELLLKKLDTVTAALCQSNCEVSTSLMC